MNAKPAKNLKPIPERRQSSRSSCVKNFPQSDLRNPQSGQAAAELDAGKGVPIARVREDIKTWAKN